MVSWVLDMAQGHYQDRFIHQGRLSTLTNKAKTLYIELKEEEILGLFLLMESSIFQNCVKESKMQNGTLSLMYQSQRT